MDLFLRFSTANPQKKTCFGKGAGLGGKHGGKQKKKTKRGGTKKKNQKPKVAKKARGRVKAQVGVKPWPPPPQGFFAGAGGVKKTPNRGLFSPGEKKKLHFFLLLRIPISGGANKEKLVPVGGGSSPPNVLTVFQKNGEGRGARDKKKTTHPKKVVPKGK